MANLTDFEHDELIMLHEDLNRAVTETRQRAWSTTNYVALLHVGGIGYIQLLTYPRPCLILLLLAIASALLTGIGIRIVKKTVDEGDQIRKRMAEIEPYFGTPYREDWKKHVKDRNEKQGRDWEIGVPLCGIQLLLCALFIYYIATILCNGRC